MTESEIRNGVNTTLTCANLLHRHMNYVNMTMHSLKETFMQPPGRNIVFLKGCRLEETPVNGCI